jgi:hypothetical protein
MGNQPAKGADSADSSIAAQRSAGRTSAGPPAGSSRSPAGMPASQVPRQGPESRRASVRDALDAALNGAVLCSRDRQFLARLVKWDKRNAASVAALLWRARLAGRAEAALTGQQLEIVLGALTDAAAYRESGAQSIGCWDCENFPGGRCAEHARDLDLARTCAELASVLAAGKGAVAGLPQPSDIAGHRQYSTVAS